MRDGGPAFPIFDDFHGEIVHGMSLRHWTAVHALAGLLTNPSMISPGQLKASGHHDRLVSLAYEIADTMIAEREDST